MPATSPSSASSSTTAAARSTAIRQAWRAGRRACDGSGRCPTRIKISALTAYDRRPTAESLCDVTRHCIDCFGVDRSLFGSDFPVGRLWTTFDAMFDGFKAMIQDFSESEQSALFHANARRVAQFHEPRPKAER